MTFAVGGTRDARRLERQAGGTVLADGQRSPRDSVCAVIKPARRAPVALFARAPSLSLHGGKHSPRVSSLTPCCCCFMKLAARSTGVRERFCSCSKTLMIGRFTRCDCCVCIAAVVQLSLSARNFIEQRGCFSEEKEIERKRRNGTASRWST